MRRALLAVLLLAAIGGAIVLAGVPGGGTRSPFDASGCPRGFSRLSDEYVRELREGTQAADEAERRREEPEERGRGICLRDGVRRPEPFSDLARAHGAAAQRMGFGFPAQYARAARAKRRLRATPIAGTAGRWTPVGDGPVTFDNPAYANTNGLANGLKRSTGRVTDFAYDEAGNRLFAAVSNGGVWMSTDRGKSWRSIGDGLPTQITGALAWTPAHGGTLVVLTGDNAFGGNTYPGLGAYSTTDLGKTWTKSKGVPDGAQGFRLVVQPDRPEVLYAATGYGLLRSSDGGRSFTDVELPTGACAGRSTTRKGCFLANVVTDVQVMGPDDFGHAGGPVTAAVGWRAGQRRNPDGSIQAPSNGIYTSQTGAPGSFAKTPDSRFLPTPRVGRVSLGSASGPGQDHAILYALVQDAVLFDSGKILGLDVPEVPNPLGGNLTATPTYLNGVYVSKDFGRTWRLMSTGTQFLLPTNGSTLAAMAPLGTGPGIQAWYNSWIQPDPYTQTREGAPKRVDLGLEEIYESRTTGLAQTGLTDFVTVAPYSTTSAGCILTVVNKLCSQVAEVLGSTTHPDQQGAIFLPPGPDRSRTLVVGNDGGIYDQRIPRGDAHLTASGFGAGNVNGLNTLLAYSVAAAKDGTIYSGLQDNGTIRVDPGTGEQDEVLGGDGTYALVDPDDSSQVLMAPAGGALTVTHDGGRTNADVLPGGAKALQFLTPFVFDDTSSSRIVFGARNLYEADRPIREITDPSAFHQIYDLGTVKHPGDPAAVAAKGDPDNVATALAMRDARGYAGFCGSCDPVKDNERFKAGFATNAGGTWHVTAARGLPQRLISAIAADPTESHTVYVALGESTIRQFAPPNALGDDGVQAGGGHVYKSTDDGQTFTDVSGNLPDIGATSLLVRGGQLVVGTTVGAFASSTKAGGSWGELGDDLPAAPVYAMQLKPGDPASMYVASFGRGLYRYDFADPCDLSAPVSRISTRSLRALGRRRRGRLTGSSSDRGCGPRRRGRVVRVSVAIERPAGKRCRYLRATGRFTRPSSCSSPRYVRARGTRHWSLVVRRRLPAGRYRIRVRAIDAAGNVERRTRASSARRITLRR